MKTKFFAYKMGKFAGFLKRVKKVAGMGSAVLNGLNSVYKAVKPFSEDIIGALPFGSYINKCLDVGSKLIDKVNPIAQGWLKDEDKEQAKKISDNIKRHGGDIAQKALNNYLDEQDELFNRKGKYSLNDYVSDSAGNALSGLIKNKGSIFGNPLN